MIRELIAAALGTVAFALLFCVPRAYYLHCGAVGAAGWLVYSLASQWGATVAEATFFATVLVILLSRIFAVRERCPATIFVICGIFPLVPGAGIYWTAYYLVTNQLSDALSSGFAAVKAAIALVLGIVVVFELPHKWFRLASKRQP
ncbi:MAG: threonine/serine exporter family protein [Lachnospiraceae bacterium]|nr:threonine/serine exporter family protein [Lachnospiraceae bacterium]